MAARWREHHGRPSRATLVLLATVAAILLAQAGLAGSAAPSSQDAGDNGQTIRVNCDVGQTIGRALAASRPGATILISGTCRETVTVGTDRVTLDGQGTAVLDGQGAGVVLTVDGARGVTLKGVTVQNGGRGIDGLNLATFAIEDSVVQQNRSHGVEITNASVGAQNLVSRDNGRAGLIVNRNALLNVADSTFHNNLTGLVVFSNANARLTDTNSMSQNATQGFTVGLGAAVFSLGSTVLANDNGEEGVLLLQDGALQLIGGRLEATGNGLDGVRADQLSSLTVGIAEFGVPGDAVVADNGRHGINLAGGSHLVVSDIMPLSSRANALSGLRVDGGSIAEVNGSEFENNGEDDVALTFGSIATLNDNLIGSISCDATALSRGTTTCP